jgi:hypothetical protein
MLTGSPSIPADVQMSRPREPKWRKHLRQFLGYESAPLEREIQKTFKQRLLKAIPVSAALMLGLTLMTWLNTTPSQSWCR